MIYKAWELLANLKFLTPTVTDGKVEWIGKDKDWNKIKQQLRFIKTVAKQ